MDLIKFEHAFHFHVVEVTWVKFFESRGEKSKVTWFRGMVALGTKMGGGGGGGKRKRGCREVGKV